MANTPRVGVLPLGTCTAATARVPQATSHWSSPGTCLLFAATERGFDFFEGREIFLEPINMLLHLDDG